jgi:hypothetical protein
MDDSWVVAQINIKGWPAKNPCLIPQTRLLYLKGVNPFSCRQDQVEVQFLVQARRRTTEGIGKFQSHPGERVRATPPNDQFYRKG